MGVDNFLNAGATGKRQAKRARVLIAAKLQTSRGEFDVRLRDISRLGALVEGQAIPPVGESVVFTRGSTFIPARVAWSGANRGGLAFDYPIDEQEVMIQLKKPTGSGGASMPRFRRPGLAEGLSDTDRKLAQAWSVQVGLTVPGVS